MNFWTIVVAFLCVILPVSAHAETVRLDYAAESDCPDPEAFRRAIESRARRAVTWADTDYSLWIGVHIQVQEDRVVGVLESADRGGVRPARSFDGANCQAVADALALIAALTIFSDNAETPKEPEQPVERKESNMDSTTKEREPEAPTEEGKPPWRVRLGIGASMVSGIAPVTLFAAVLPVALESPLSGVWSPEFTIMPMTAETGTVGAEGPAGKFSWFAFRTEACTLKLGFKHDFFLSPCVAFDFGTVRAAGAPLGTPVESRRSWAALGTTSHLRIQGAAWFADLGGAVMFPLVHTHYLVEDTLGASYVLHKTATGVGEVSLAIGLRFDEP